MLHLLGNPADIIFFNPALEAVLPLNPIKAILKCGIEMNSEGRSVIKNLDQELSPYLVNRVRYCFFLACAAFAKLIDIFYGDFNLSIDFKESDEFLRLWSEANQNAQNDWQNQQQVMTQSSSLITADSSTLIASQLTFSNGIGGNFLKNALHGSSHSSKSRATSDRSIVAPVPSLQTNIDDIPLDVAKPDSCQFVWHYLHSNKAQDPFIGEHQPKVSRMLDLFMDWLVKSALVRPSRYSSIYGIFYQLIL
ncbi:unnamed protein product [Dracunculus medinensis]|uniref:Uncharacterized protein n=1 Tax=Dracunculus medinensis TaxID=318479 RepID=A0A0N4URN4_DRAME|nr:unnamed protein product [Dracunculus medinensis]